MFRLTDKTRKMKQQRGLYAVEFAIVGSVFLIALFMVIEFGRLLFTWNVLDEITRRGARLAAVCPVMVTPTPSASFFDRATMGGTTINIASGELIIKYFDSDGTPQTDPDDIDFVRASIVGYKYQAFFPISLFFDAPAFETTLPAESLGVLGLSPPDTGVTEC